MTSLCPLNSFSAGKVLLSSGGTFLLLRCHLYVGVTKAGKSIIMISSEMPEIIGMSDRVLIVSEGRIKGELTGKDIDQENVIRYAAG